MTKDDKLSDDKPGSGKPGDEKSRLEGLRAEQQLLHALLTGLHEDENVREDRIAATMERFAATQTEAPLLKRSWRNSRTARWLAAAAAVMFAGFLWSQFLQPTQLTAAVDRVETAAVEPVTRIYDIRLHAELPNGATFAKRGRLHTKSTDQFVINIGDRKRPMIFGADGEQDWFIVSRRSGYVDEVRENWPKSPFIEERMHRFMLANQFLQSLSDNYEVELLDEPKPASIDRPCTALLGKRISNDRRSPSEVRIWADRETGVPLGVALTWDDRFRFKPQKVLMEFVGEKPVGENFYTLEHHFGTLE